MIVTFPFYLLPGPFKSENLGLLRLGRLARLLVVGKNLVVLRRIYRRLNRAVGYMLIILVLCAFVAYEAEDGADGFTTFTDALWWGIVTLTTVGYGDVVPESTGGRVAGVMLMITALALLGTVAGALSSVLGVDPDEEEARLTDLEDEIRAVRTHLEELLTRLPPAAGEPSEPVD